MCGCNAKTKGPPRTWAITYPPTPAHPEGRTLQTSSQSAVALAKAHGHTVVETTPAPAEAS